MAQSNHMAQKSKVIKVVAGISILGIFLYLFLQKTAKSFKYGTPRVLVHTLDGINVVLRIFLPVINSGNVSIPVNAFNGFIYDNESQKNLASVNLLSSTTVVAQKSTDVPFESKVSVFTIGQELINLIQTKKLKLNRLYLVGTITVADVEVAFKEPLVSA